MESATEDKKMEQDKTSDLDQDTIHELLSNERRRAILRILDEQGETDKSDLAELVAAEEYDKEVSDLDSQERKRVYISLSQQHLSALEDARVIESNGTVQLTERADELLWHLEGKPEDNLCDKVRKTVNNLF